MVTQVDDIGDDKKKIQSSDKIIFVLTTSGLLIDDFPFFSTWRKCQNDRIIQISAYIIAIKQRQSENHFGIRNVERSGNHFCTIGPLNWRLLFLLTRWKCVEALWLLNLPSCEYEFDGANERDGNGKRERGKKKAGKKGFRKPLRWKSISHLSFSFTPISECVLKSNLFYSPPKK